MRRRTFLKCSVIATAGASIPKWIRAAGVFTDFVLHQGDNLQAAINAAQPGDSLTLDAGAEFIGSFSLPNKAGASYITIRSSALSSLPAGTRVSPASVVHMATIRTNVNNGPAIFTQTSAHHYRFQGIEFKTTIGVSSDGGVVRLGSNPRETSLSQITHDFDFDRCYIHGQPGQNVQQGIVLEAQDATVQNCYISEVHYVGTDSQAILTITSPGGLHIINNHLEAAGENFLAGGADPKIPNLVPGQTGGIEIRRNFFFKPLSWKVGDPSYAGIHWTVKNLLELKNAKNVVIDGNIFQNNWVDGQTGIPILFTVRNQEGTAPWSILENVTFSNNTITGCKGVFNLLGSDNEQPSQRSTGLVVRNNLSFDNTGEAYITFNGYYNVTFDHNTDIHVSGNTITLNGEDSLGFVYRNNLSIATPFEIFAADGSGSQGTAALNIFTPGFTWAKNVLVAPTTTNPVDTCGGTTCYPASVALVGFVNFAGKNYRLQPTSPYHNAGTDGKDIGVDYDALLAAQNGTGPTPPPGTGGVQISGRVTISGRVVSQ